MAEYLITKIINIKLLLLMFSSKINNNIML